MHLESIGTFVPTVADSLREKKCKSTMLLQLTLHEERDCIVFWRHHWKKEESTDCSACSKCNNKKSNSGGWWILKGHIGHLYFSILWVFTLAVVFICAVLILSGVMTPEGIRHFISDSLYNAIACLVSSLLKAAHDFIRTFLG